MFFASVVGSAVISTFSFCWCFCFFVVFALHLSLALVEGLEEVFLIEGCCLRCVCALEEVEDLVLKVFDGFPLPLPLVLGRDVWTQCPPNEFFAILALMEWSLERKGCIFFLMALLIRLVVWR